MLDLLKRLTGFQDISLKRLDGYDNVNYRLTSERGVFIFKTYPYREETFDLVIAENTVLLGLQQEMGNLIPRPVQLKGEYCRVEKVGGEKLICRMLTYLKGSFLGDIEHSSLLFSQFGTFLARLDRAMLALPTNYVYRGRKWEWDLQYLELNRPSIAAITSAADRSIVEYFFQQFAEVVGPELPYLRRSLIHNDANEWNVLATPEGGISGLIDFGDLAYAPLINELAVALTYACYDKGSPLEWAEVLLSAYHAVLPLEGREIKLLYYLIAARLCISVCNSARARRADPQNTYISVSEKPAWAMLRRWLAIGPIRAERVFRSAIGLPQRPVRDVRIALNRRQLSLSKILSISYKKPLQLERAAFQYMYGCNGESFLDAYNNIPHVGHAHPRVVAAGQRQMARLNTNTRYLYDLLPEYAERLLALFPPKLNKVFFVNSGSAASDLAIRMARAHTTNDQLVVMEHGYHGNTQLGINVSDYKFSNPKGQGQGNNIIKLPIPDTYRGEFKIDDGSAGSAYAKAATAQLKGHDKIAAFISEPIVGCGGQVPLAKGYLKTIYPEIRRRGGLCISDEVQTGFGRLGHHFWGFEAQGVVPDMVILGKPMGNGHPIGAVVCTDAIAESFAKGVEFFSSFGGNPVSCAIGLEVLNVIEEEGLQAHALAVGRHYRSLLSELQSEFAAIGDIRGSGLFLGVELVRPGTLEANTKLATQLKNKLRDKYVLVSTDGPFDSVIKTKPPLVFNQRNAEEVVEKMREILTELAQE